MNKTIVDMQELPHEFGDFLIAVDQDSHLSAEVSQGFQVFRIS